MQKMMHKKPIENSYQVDKRVYAGEYAVDKVYIHC